MANSEPFMVNAATDPPTNVGVRKNDRSTSGSATWCSTARKTASSTAARHRHTMTPVSAHRVSPALISP